MILPLLAALAMLFEVNLVGRLTGTEILFLLALPFALMRLPKPSPAERKFYLMAALWFAGALITDIIRQTAFDDLVRGWSKIAFFVVNFTVIRAFTGKNINALVNFIFFLFMASALRLALGIADESMALNNAPDQGSWKFGYGQFITVCALMLSSRLMTSPIGRPAGLILPYMTSALNLWMNARNLTGLSALAAVVTTITRPNARPLSRARLVLLLALIGLSGLGVVQIYKYAAANGMLGYDAQQKYEKQTQGDLGLLLGGRSEILASSQAIIDSPIIGHGSWARDIKYVQLMTERLMRAGRQIEGDPYKSDLIPTHSHLLGAWVESGILGALFWLWAIGIAIKGLLANLRRPTPRAGLYTFIGLALLWDIFFSPFSIERRICTAAWFSLMIHLQNQPDSDIGLPIKGNQTHESDADSKGSSSCCGCSHRDGKRGSPRGRG